MTETLAQSLLAGKGLDHPAAGARLIETHISWVILAGDYVYKLKKPVNLGFLDFSTLAARRHFCEEEVRLNRRTAPDIYLDVLAVSGTEREPRLDGTGTPIDYVVRMRRFDQESILDHLAERGDLNAVVTSRLARAIADFHEGIAGPREFPFDDPLAHVLAPVEANFEHLTPLVESPDEKQALAHLKTWTDETFEATKPVFKARYEHGFTRECHGDLHLGNILYRDGRCIPFDCIEFNPELRWIDTASDIAFTVMDMETHDLHAHAHQLLIEYLERTGDYDLLSVLRYYLVYRAMVRAKVDAIRSRQDEAHAGSLLSDCERYLQMALRYTEPGHAGLVLMCGLSGTGKTTIGRHIAAGTGAIQIRSDVERKRIFGLPPEASSHSQGLDIYTDDANEKTFTRLEQLSRDVCNNQYLAVVDATFIDIDLRRRFETLAASLQIPWCIVHCTAREETVAERLGKRTGDASEADLEQYRAQKSAFDDFDEPERHRLVVVDTESADSIVSATRRLLKSLDTASPALTEQ